MGFATELVSSVLNILSGGNRQLRAGEDAVRAGNALAMFYAAGGPVAIKSQPSDQLLAKFDVPIQGRKRKKAAVDAILAHGYEPMGPALRMGNPPYYALPVRRSRL